jgi:hypothetical protein
MNPFSSVSRRSSMRMAIAGAAALSLVALPACGSDDDSDTPATVFDTVAPSDNSNVDPVPAAPGDTTTVGTMAPGDGTVAP